MESLKRPREDSNEIGNPSKKRKIDEEEVTEPVLPKARCGYFMSEINKQTFDISDGKHYLWNNHKHEINIINEGAFSIRMVCSINSKAEKPRKFFYYWEPKTKSWNEVIAFGREKTEPVQVKNFPKNFITTENFWIFKDDEGYFYYFRNNDQREYFEVFGYTHHNRYFKKTIDIPNPLEYEDFSLDIV